MSKTQFNVSNFEYQQFKFVQHLEYLKNLKKLQKTVFSSEKRFEKLILNQINRTKLL